MEDWLGIPARVYFIGEGDWIATAVDSLEFRFLQRRFFGFSAVRFGSDAVELHFCIQIDGICTFRSISASIHLSFEEWPDREHKLARVWFPDGDVALGVFTNFCFIQPESAVGTNADRVREPQIRKFAKRVVFYELTAKVCGVTPGGRAEQQG